MTSEHIKCPLCGYKYYTDVEKIDEDGETVAVRLGFSDIKKWHWYTKIDIYAYNIYFCMNCQNTIVLITKKMI